MYQRGLLFEDEFGVDRQDPSYVEVELEEMKQERYASSCHAAQVMIYCPAEVTAMKVFNVKAYVLMQLRFDGYIGFPGGLLEPGETPEEAIAREIEEEFGILRQNFRIYADDHIVTFYSEDKDLFFHLFCKDVNLERLSSIEAAALKNDRYGDEVMGLLRVPLFTMADGFRGFPSFLKNNFLPIAKKQLLKALLRKGIMKKEEIDAAVAAVPKYTFLKVNK